MSETNQAFLYGATSRHRNLSFAELLSANTVILASLATLFAFNSASADAPDEWQKHIIHEGAQSLTAVAADFTGDGMPDVISNSAGKTRLFVSPNWREVVLDENPDHDFIHSEFFDVDRDGDSDYIGARYNPGLIVWLECPDKPLLQSWTLRLVDDQVHGIHGLIKGDVDRDGHPDLLATSAQPKPPFPNSLAWFRVPAAVHSAPCWERNVFAKNDAPGLTHYLGFGDVNGDGRPDAATGAKGGPQAETGTGNWFAWWEAGSDPRQSWQKHLIADNQPGATNIHPADVNGDGQTDFVASRGHGRGVVWFAAPNWDEHVIHGTIKEPHCLVAADLDGDKDLDVATCAYGDQLAAWFENDGEGEFKTHIVGRNQESYDIRAVDLDVDGDLDLLIAGRGSKNVVWYENPHLGAVKMSETMGGELAIVRQQLIDLGLYRITDRVLSLARACVRTESSPSSDEAIAVGASKFGGAPDVPPGFDWPLWNERPLSFLGQIGLIELSDRANCAALPKRGTLSFFYDSEQSTWGFDPEDAGSWRVYHFRDAHLQRQPTPVKFPGYATYTPCKLEFSDAMSFPSWESLFIQELMLSDDERDRYIDFENANQEFSASAHKILGHPDEVQGEMQLECQLVSNGIYCGSHNGYEDPRVAEFKANAVDWTLLLQCDSDDNVGWTWGDLGRLYFWIKHTDLEREDFDDVWTILQCN